MSISVAVDYHPVVPLGANQVEVDGSTFNCDTECQSLSVCCESLGTTGSRKSNGCMKCECQHKQVKCNGCHSCSGRTTNQTIYGSRATATLPCLEAVPIANDNSRTVYNRQSILTQCDPSKRLLCCRADSSVNKASCGPYWGPDNPSGDCDAIMQTFCNNNPTDPDCACLKSEFTPAKCIDKRCAQTDAFKTYDMIHFKCAGNYLTCIQWEDIEGKDNVINNTQMEQECNQIVGGSGTPGGGGGGASATSAMPVWVWVLIAVGVVLFVVIIILLVRTSRPTKTRFRQGYPYPPVHYGPPPRPIIVTPPPVVYTPPRVPLPPPRRFSPFPPPPRPLPPQRPIPPSGPPTRYPSPRYPMTPRQGPPPRMPMPPPRGPPFRRPPSPGARMARQQGPPRSPRPSQRSISPRPTSPRPM